MILDLAVRVAIAALNLVVFGLHALWPLRLARSAGADPGAAEKVPDASARRLWAAVAPLALLAAAMATVWAIGRRPDEAIAWGMTGVVEGSLPARLIALAVAAALASDLLVLVAWPRLEPNAWRFHAAIGALALVAQSLGAELLRIGWGPWSGTAAIFVAAAIRALLALAAAEIVLGPPGKLSLAAGPALLALYLVWPRELRGALRADLVTLGAACVLLAGARFAPGSLRRGAAVAGLVLALVFLARSADLSSSLGVREELHEFELEPGK